MKLTIRKEETGINNYCDGRQCPIASALKDAGWNKVYVFPRHWRGIKDGIKYEGKIPAHVDNMADELSMKKSYEDVKFELPEPELKKI